MVDKKKKILLIEDDADLRETAKEFLSDEGYKVFAAENGATGIQQALQLHPDAIICDINMPGLTGYEVYNMLQQITTTSTIPFIFLSAKSSKEDILTGLHLGVDDYITKPFEMGELVQVINKRIEHRKKLLELHDERFNVLFKNTYSGACVLNKTTFEYVNQPLEKLFGYSSDELIGLSIANIVHGESLLDLTSTFEKCIEGAKESFDFSLKAIRKDNQIVSLGVKGGRVLLKGEPRIICTFVEIDKDSEKSEKKEKKTSVKLSERELEVLNFVCQGYSNAEIAVKLFLSERTIEGHRSRLFLKSGTKNAVSLAMWAVKNKLVVVN
jgi:PAS domain S-box-containing protein